MSPQRVPFELGPSALHVTLMLPSLLSASVAVKVEAAPFARADVQLLDDRKVAPPEAVILTTTLLMFLMDETLQLTSAVPPLPLVEVRDSVTVIGVLGAVTFPGAATPAACGTSRTAMSTITVPKWNHDTFFILLSSCDD